MTRRWLFGDQLGPVFLDTPDQPVLLVESKAVFRRRRFHRAKAHLLLSAMRHRAAELGEQCVYVQAETYGEALEMDVMYVRRWSLGLDLALLLRTPLEVLRARRTA